MVSFMRLEIHQRADARLLGSRLRGNDKIWVVVAVALPLVFGALMNANAAGEGVPDLAGSWGRLSVDFEQPASDLGPVTNLNRKPDGSSNGARRVGNYNDPNLMPAAAAEIKRMGAISLTGETFPNPQNQCRPQGVPYVLWQLGMQLLQDKDEVTLLYLVDQQVQHVRMNQSHPAHVVPSWSGDSVGHYEGDTLVVDTVGGEIRRVLHDGPIRNALQPGFACDRTLSSDRRHGGENRGRARDA
jgi:hypothetical protein